MKQASCKTIYWEIQWLYYDQTLSQVTPRTAIRTFLAASVHHEWYINHIGTSTVFLHFDLKNKQVKQTEKYTLPNEEIKVRKLQKAIYGLQQSSRIWHKK